MAELLVEDVERYAALRPRGLDSHGELCEEGSGESRAPTCDAARGSGGQAPDPHPSAPSAGPIDLTSCRPRNRLHAQPVENSALFDDGQQAKVFGRCEATTGNAPFDRLVAQVMSGEPYRSAHRVFWIVDNGSSHRGVRAQARLRAAWPQLVLVHTPVHASCLNQIEIYFSIVQRKVLTPNDFAALAEVEDRLLRFQAHYEQAATPFEWTFTRQDLAALLAKLAAQERRAAA